jgi:hypothetical protein
MAWSTQDEIQFIKEIEDYEMLEGYAEGCAKRTNWGDIDKEAINKLLGRILRF